MLQVLPAHKVLQEQSVLLVQQVHRVIQVLVEHQEPLVQQVHKVPLAQPAPKVLPALQAQLEQLVRPEQPDQKDQLVLPAPKVQPAHKDQLVHRVQLVPQAQMVLQVLQDRLLI